MFQMSLLRSGVVKQHDVKLNSDLTTILNFLYIIYRCAYIICLLDTLTSVFAGFVVFAILGVLAKEVNMEVKDVVSSSKLQEAVMLRCTANTLCLVNICET